MPPLPHRGCAWGTRWPTVVALSLPPECRWEHGWVKLVRAVSSLSLLPRKDLLTLCVDGMYSYYHSVLRKWRGQWWSACPSEVVPH